MDDKECKKARSEHLDSEEDDVFEETLVKSRQGEITVRRPADSALSSTSSLSSDRLSPIQLSAGDSSSRGLSPNLENPMMRRLEVEAKRGFIPSPLTPPNTSSHFPILPPTHPGIYSPSSYTTSLYYQQMLAASRYQQIINNSSLSHFYPRSPVLPGFPQSLSPSMFSTTTSSAITTHTNTSSTEMKHKPGFRVVEPDSVSSVDHMLHPSKSLHESMGLPFDFFRQSAFPFPPPPIPYGFSPEKM